MGWGIAWVLLDVAGGHGVRHKDVLSCVGSSGVPGRLRTWSALGPARNGSEQRMGGGLD